MATLNRIQAFDCVLRISSSFGEALLLLPAGLWSDLTTDGMSINVDAMADLSTGTWEEFQDVAIDAEGLPAGANPDDGGATGITVYFSAMEGLPPTAWLENLSAKYPGVLADLTYVNPDQDIAGRREYERGEVRQVVSDEPVTYQWYQALGRSVDDYVADCLGTEIAQLRELARADAQVLEAMMRADASGSIVLTPAVRTALLG